MNLDRNGLNEQEFLKQYDAGDYPRPSVAVDIVIFAIADVEEDNGKLTAHTDWGKPVEREDGKLPDRSCFLDVQITKVTAKKIIGKMLEK